MKFWILATSMVFGVAGLAQGVELRPFRADYDVFVDGKQAGQSRIELQLNGEKRWTHKLIAEGTRGLAKLARFSTEQAGELDLQNGQPRLLSAQMTSRSLVRDRDLSVRFDWPQSQVRWSGDIEADQPTTRSLQGRPATGSILNLLLAFDAAVTAPGQRVHYVLHDRGRASELDYVIAAPESVQVPLGTFSAVRVRGERAEKQRVTTVWYASELPPTPVRMLQTEHGKDKYELRLRAIKPD